MLLVCHYHNVTFSMNHGVPSNQVIYAFKGKGHYNVNMR